MRAQTWLAALLVAAPWPAAAEVTVRTRPVKPRLGDTISVWVEGAPSPPVVIVGRRRFPAFDIGGRYRAFVPVSPLDKPGRWTIEVEAGDERTFARVAVAARWFGIQRITLPPTVKTRADPRELARIAIVKALASPQKHWTSAFGPPAAGRVSSAFGVRRIRNGILLADYYHRGLDYAPGAGAPAVSPAGGRIVLVGRVEDGFRVNGNTVGIDHGHGVVSLLLHLSRTTVHEGDLVRAGETVGLVGATGEATGPHLHWGFYVNGVAVDPEPWMREAPL